MSTIKTHTHILKCCAFSILQEKGYKRHKLWLLSSCAVYEKRANAQIAHLVFANTKANAEKPKEHFFTHAKKKHTEI